LLPPAQKPSSSAQNRADTGASKLA